MNNYVIILLILLIALIVILMITSFTQQKNLNQKINELQNLYRITNDMQKEISLVQNNHLSGLTQNVSDSLLHLEQRFQTFELSNEQKLDAIRTTVEKRLNYLQNDNNQQLEKIRETVDEKLQTTLENNLTQSFKLVNERLESVYKGLGEMQTLASGVGDLKKVLSNVKTRGILGEIQLGAILEEILAPEQYVTNYPTVPGSKNVVEYAIKLPGDQEPVYLPIDSKFPSDAYIALQEAYESGDNKKVQACNQILIQRLKSFAKDIRSKYIEPPYTTDFAIFFYHLKVYMPKSLI